LAYEALDNRARGDEKLLRLVFYLLIIMLGKFQLMVTIIATAVESRVTRLENPKAGLVGGRRVQPPVA
jgi:hypothetical protein